YNPMLYHHDIATIEKVFIGKNYEENYKILVQKVRERKHNIPPLVNAYMNLSSTMRTFGTALNTSFGEVEETGIILTIDDIYGIKKDRHLHFEKGEKPVHLS
ncbi:MAG: hemolysin, partial [Bacteroidales bacterium]|nr:hemolysin [Bacteroidales bacterium]